MRTRGHSFEKWGLGLGMDLSWSDKAIFSQSDGRGFLTERMRAFLSRYAGDFHYHFFSLQPRSFDMLLNSARIEEYFAVFDEVIGLLPRRDRVALHHTFLNLGSHERDYPRDLIAELTNQLVRRYDIKWINEDLGVWSLMGKLLPYPLPPILNAEGLRHSIRNVSFYKERLACPLYVEFPGFSEGASFHIGRMNAFEFFRDLIRETDATCVLDTGHILSYQWLLGNRQGRYLDRLEELLPFENCREIHLSGCSVIGDRFVDFHHGILMDEQLVLLDFMLERCPNLQGVTYEDPKFDQEGKLIAKSIVNFEKLKSRVEKWSRDERVHRMDVSIAL